MQNYVIIVSSRPDPNLEEGTAAGIAALLGKEEACRGLTPAVLERIRPFLCWRKQMEGKLLHTESPRIHPTMARPLSK